ncbi:hypothetical protein RclHR1_01350004 [Rhizophagus clarus]|nr:hypothetical protein RclHR1_01350004 [Rhizophagus clarus]
MIIQANHVVERWYNLQNLLTRLRTSVGDLKESQEILRSIDQLKERILNIEPTFFTKYDLEKLDKVQSEIDCTIEPKIKALDEITNDLTPENALDYIQQRCWIAEALINLTSIMGNKRTKLWKAHN